MDEELSPTDRLGKLKKLRDGLTAGFGYLMGFADRSKSYIFPGFFSDEWMITWPPLIYTAADFHVMVLIIKQHILS